MGIEECMENFKLDSSLYHNIIQTANTVLLRCQTKENVIKECLWMLSNLLSCPLEDFLSNDVVVKDVQQIIFNILPHLRSSNPSIQKEVKHFHSLNQTKT